MTTLTVEAVTLATGAGRQARCRHRDADGAADCLYQCCGNQSLAFSGAERHFLTDKGPMRLADAVQAVYIRYISYMKQHEHDGIGRHHA